MFEEWYLNDLINEKIKKSWKLCDLFLLTNLDRILKTTGIFDLLQTKISLNSIISKLGYDNKVFFSVKWIFDRLSLDGYIDIYEISENEVLYCHTGKEYIKEPQVIYEEALKIAPLTKSTFELIKIVSSNYPLYLQGKKTGVDILFNEESINVMNEFYCINEFYAVHNIGGAKILNYDVDARDNPTILEIGGGMGGGTKQFILQRIAAEKPLDNFNYIFTEVANKLLRATKKEISQLTDKQINIDYRKFDFNTDFTLQGYEKNSIDVIWGVNALHVAKDLKNSIKLMYDLLKPGGSLIISETVRADGNPMVQQEFILNTLDSYWDVELDKEIRPQYGFMHWKNWLRAFELAGFSKFETIPDMSSVEKEYDNCYVSIIRGIK